LDGNLEKWISAEFEAAAALLQIMAQESSAQIIEAAQMLVDCLLMDHKVLIFGNGGSAADAQHFAAELAGRYRMKRRALPALALTTDTSTLTAVSNDFGFTEVFSRQVEAFARPGDVAVGISTSGRSANVIAGLQTAQVLGAQTIALIGSNITGLAGVADQVISVPSQDTPRIQEAHAVIIHILCDLVEKALLAQNQASTKMDGEVDETTGV
jgi:D-sedoheptulose 7-phosphate isomerase